MGGGEAAAGPLTQQAARGQRQRLQHGEVHVQPLAVVWCRHLRQGKERGTQEASQQVQAGF
jgi:hypothetical protein